MVRLAFELEVDKSASLVKSFYSSSSTPKSPSSTTATRRSSPEAAPHTCSTIASKTLINPFTHLPPELIFHVISFLSYQDSVRLSETSKVCYQYGNDDMVWKSLIQSQLGITFLDGSELVFDEHIHKRRSPNNMEVEDKEPKTWKERFQYLLPMKADLNPVHFRSLKSIRLPMLDAERPPCGGAGECDGGGNCGSKSLATPSTLGCKHYKRDCKLLAACCGRFFVCRHCHDEHVHDHRIDRYATQLVLCMACKAIQPVGKTCASPQCNGRILGAYFCATCKFYDNDPDKAIFHCEFCQVCKLGRKSESFHCHVCGRCFSKAVMATHPCLNKRQQTVTDER